MTQTPMLQTRRSFLATAGALLVAATPSFAAQRRYTLNAKASRVGFTFALKGVAQKGTMPISQADIRIDPDNLTNSKVDVSVSVRKAKTGLIFATDALKSPDVLDAAAHPNIRFVSTHVKLGAGGRISDGAKLTGKLTIRGVTKPVTLNASVYRQAGSATDDLEALSVRLTGAVSRRAFGASGYSDLVDDRIALDIQAAIRTA